MNLPSAQEINAQILAALEQTPEQAARHHRLARELGTLPDLVEAAGPQAEKDAAFNRISGAGIIPERNPGLAKALADARRAPLLTDDIGTLQMLEEQAQALRSSSTWTDEVVGNYQKEQAYKNYANAYLNGGATPEQIKEIAGANRAMKRVQQNAPAFLKQYQEDFANASTLGAAGLMFGTRGGWRTITSQVASIAPTIEGAVKGGISGGAIGGAVGSVLPGFGTIGGAVGGAGRGAFAGATMAQMASAYGQWVDKELEQAGIDTSSEEDLARAFQDKTLMQRIQGEAARYGLVMGAVGVATMGVGGKFVGALGKGATAGQVAKATAKELGVQSAGEAAGEAAGQLAADGTVDGKEVVAEAVGGLMFGGVDVAVNIGRKGLEAAGRQTKEGFTGLKQALQKSKTVQRTPDVAAEILNTTTNNAEVYLDGEKTNALFQRDPEALAEVEREIPGFSERLAEAAATGGEVALKVGDYSAHILAKLKATGTEEYARMGLASLNAAEASDPDYVNAIIQDILRDDAASADAQERQAVAQQVDADVARLTQALNDSGKYSLQQVRDYQTLFQALATGSKKYGIDLFSRLNITTDIFKTREQSLKEDPLYAQVLETRAYLKKKNSAASKVAQKAKDLFGGEVTKKPAPKRPMPVVRWLQSQGYVSPKGAYAAELRQVLDADAARVFRKNGKVRLDNIPAGEFNSAFEKYGLTAPEEEGFNGYVNPEWLLEQIRNETFGDGALNEAQRNAAAKADNYEYIQRLAEEKGLSITSDDPLNVVEALRKEEGGKFSFEEKSKKVLFQEETIKDNAESMVSAANKEEAENEFDNKGLFDLDEELKNIGIKNSDGSILFKDDFSTFKKIIDENPDEDIIENYILPAEKLSENFLRINKEESLDQNINLNDFNAVVFIDKDEETYGVTLEPKDIKAFEKKLKEKRKNQYVKNYDKYKSVKDIEDGISHYAKKAAFQSMIENLGIEYRNAPSMSKSQYIEIKNTLGGEYKIRFSDHANTSIYHESPDVNVTTATEVAEWERSETFYDALKFIWDNKETIRTKDGGILAGRIANSFDPNDKRVLYQENGRRAFVEDENGRNIVWENGDYFISVDDPKNGKYIVLWHKGKRVGTMSLVNGRSSGTRGYATVQKIEIDKEHRGKKLGRKMYEVALEFLGDQYKGIGGEYEQRSNKKQVPAIYRSLGGTELPSGDFIIDRKLYQDAAKAPQGMFEPDDPQNLITLFQGADFSTVVHEVMHHVVDVMRGAIVTNAGTDMLRQDWAALKSFVGTEKDHFTVEQEEKIARAFEAYLFEGKAPTAELEATFRRIKAWMVEIYRSIKAIYARSDGKRLTNEVRGVFDRMLATQEAIDAHRNRTPFTMMPGVEEFLSAAELARYKKKLADEVETANDRLLRKALREYKMQAKEEYQQRLTKAEADAREELSTDDQFNAAHWLETGTLPDGEPLPVPPGKLSDALILQRYGKEMLENIPASYRGGDVDPDALASGLGIGADAMLKGLVAYPGTEKAVKARAKQLLRTRVGDMLNDGTIAEQAAEQLERNAARTERLAFEASALHEKAKAEGAASSAMPSREQLHAVAKQQVGKMALNQLAARRNQARAAEVRLARKVGMSIGKKDFAEAARLKAQQLYQHLLIREIAAAQLREKKLLRLAKRFAQTEKQITATIPLQHAMAARSLLAKAGVKPFADYDERQRAANDAAALTLEAEPTERFVDEGAYDAFRAALDGSYYGEEGYRNNTTEQLETLIAGIENITAMGKAQKEDLVAGQKLDLEADVASFLQVLGALPEAKEPSIREVYRKPFQWVGLAADYAMKRLEFVVTALDGGDIINGKARSILWQPIRDAQDQRYDVGLQWEKRLHGIMQPHYKRLRGSGSISAPELNGQVFDNKLHLLGMLQHLGNESNQQKLLGGYGWEPAAMQQFLARLFQEKILVKEDIDLLQQVWNFYEDLKPLVWTVHRQLYGYVPKEIQASPLVTPFGVYRGGYVPAIPQEGLSIIGSMSKGKAEEGIKANTFSDVMPVRRPGSTKERSDAVQVPLVLDLALAINHLNTTLNFVYMAPAVRHVWKVVNNFDVKQALQATMPQAYEHLLVPYLKRAFSQTTGTFDTANARLERYSSTVARRARIVALAINPLNVVQNLANVIPAIPKLGRRAVTGPLRAAALPGVRKFAMENSAFMRGMFDNERRKMTANLQKLRRKDWHNTSGDVWAQQHGYILQRALDFPIKVGIWEAAYTKAYAEQKATEGHDVAHKKAVLYADAQVRLTQGENSPMDMAAAEYGTQFYKSIAGFMTSYFNARLNALKSDLAIAAQQNTQFKRTVQRVSAVSFQLALPAIVSLWLMRATQDAIWGEDEREEEKDTKDKILDYGVYPVVKSLLAARMGSGLFLLPMFGSAFTDEPYDDRTKAGAPDMLRPVLQFGKQTSQLLNGEEVDETRYLQNALITSSFATGLPVAALRRQAAWLMEYAQGDENPEGLADVAGGLLLGPTPEARK